MTNLTASLYIYPHARSGWFLSGGLGFSNYHVNSTPSFDVTGWGFTGGVGYDLRVGRDVSLTPVVNYVYGRVGDVNQVGFGAVRTRWKQNVVEFGLGVTFHGLPSCREMDRGMRLPLAGCEPPPSGGGPVVLPKLLAHAAVLPRPCSPPPQSL